MIINVKPLLPITLGPAGPTTPATSVPTASKASMVSIVCNEAQVLEEFIRRCHPSHLHDWCRLWCERRYWKL